MLFQIEEIASITEGKLTGRGNRTVSRLVTDSRIHCIPEESVFIALSGPHHNGHQFIDRLYAKGIRCFIVSNPQESACEEASFVIVPDTLNALHKLAAHCRKKFKGPLIAITGSNGKTIVKEWLAQIMSRNKNIIRSPKSYNSQVGVPLSLWLLDNEFEYAIIEAGISKVGEMERLERIILPDFGIMTNIGEAHQENFLDLENKIDEKLKLFEHCSSILYCKDHKLIDKIINNKYGSTEKKLFCWSRNELADLTVNKVLQKESSTILQATYRGGEISVQIPFIDHASVENAINVWLLLLVLEWNKNETSEGFKLLNPIAMRLELKKGINDCTLINDTYNSDLASLEIALDFLEQQPQQNKKTLILSDIFQSGRTNDDLYKRVSEMVHKRGVDKFIGVGESLYYQADKFQGNKKFFKSTDEFLKHFSRNQFRNEIILLKGARNFEFERISGQLEFQVHETVLEIRLNAIANNLNYFRKKLEPETKVMVMVKAFAYGSGSFEIANTLQFHGVDYLAVAYTDEGVTLREEGISLPIMVMSPDPSSLENLTRYSLEPEIYNQRMYTSFVEHTRKQGLSSYPIHIKVDTGMHRLGFQPDEVDDLIKELQYTKEVKVVSVFSHLAGSENPGLDEFTHTQLKIFRDIRQKFKNSISESKIIFHILNSAGIERFPAARFDMVRLGIGLHGIGVLPGNSLSIVSTFKSTLTQIRKIRKGESIGYGRKVIAEKDKQIGIIPVGYADGLNRKLGNGRGMVYYQGIRIPIVGDICMDMCMIDISGISASEGDEVEIFGKHVKIQEIADLLDTIPYEILTGVSRRVKRIYIQE